MPAWEHVNPESESKFKPANGFGAADVDALVTSRTRGPHRTASSADSLVPLEWHSDPFDASLIPASGMLNAFGITR